MDANPHDTGAQWAQTIWVRRLARRLLHDAALAEDAAQECSIAAWQHGPRDAPAPTVWLATTVRRLAARTRRGAARRGARERAAARDEALPSAAELVERAEAHRALVAAVIALDEPYRSTILLRYVEDLPPRAIARRAGIPVASVKTRLARGLERLRRQLRREHGDASDWLGLLVALPPTDPATPILFGTTLVKTSKLGAAVLLVLLLPCVGLLVLRATQEAELVEHSPASAARERNPRGVLAPDVDPSAPARLGLEPHATAPAPALDAVPELERLSGRVLDLEQRPIAGARIEALHSPTDGTEIFAGGLAEPARELVATESDAQGRFMLELPYGILVELRASAAGFASDRLTTRFGGAEILIHLGASAGVSGRVTRAADGTAVAGAFVRLWGGAEQSVERMLRTDALGRYRAEDLPPGRLGLIVVPESEAHTRYAELELAPGQVLQHDVVVDAGWSVAGRVLDRRSGTPIAGAEVSAHDFVFKTVRTDAHGAFEIAGLFDRALTLEARAPGYGRGEQRVLDEATPVEVLLQAGRFARGRVLAPGGEPLAGAFVAAIAGSSEGGTRRTDLRTTRSGPDGRFELADLRADLAHVLLVRASGVGTSFHAFPPDESQSTAVEFGDLELAACAALEGRVLDAAGAPLAGLSVDLRPAGTAPELKLADLHGQRVVQSDATGRFVFRELAPGDWRLYAHSPDHPPLVEERLRLAPGEFRRGFDLHIRAGLAIEGSVGDERGHPLAGVVLRALPEAGPPGPRWSVSDAQGRFRVSGLLPGAYTLLLHGPRAEADTVSRHESLREPHVEAGTRGLELRLAGRSSSIRGRVLGADGMPLAGAFVARIEDGVPPEEFVLSDSQGRFELPVAPQTRVELIARPGITLARAPRTPTYSEYRAGRVVAEDAGQSPSAKLQPGSVDVELRLAPPR